MYEVVEGKCSQREASAQLVPKFKRIQDVIRRAMKIGWREVRYSEPGSTVVFSVPVLRPS